MGSDNRAWAVRQPRDRRASKPSNVVFLDDIVPFTSMETGLTGACVTQDGKVVWCNGRFADMFGFSRAELPGNEIAQLFELEVRKNTLDGVRAIHTMAFDPSPRSSVREVAGRKKDGQVIDIRQSVSQLKVRDRSLMLWHVLDITEDKAVRASLRQMEQKLSNLAEQVLEAQENERKRVASELHDGIGQTLSAIKYGLESACRELTDSLPAKTRAKLMENVSSIQAAVDEVRGISMGLRPSMLDDLGIEATLNWLCREFRATNSSIELTKDVDVYPESICGALSVVIFRIVQEAFNNVAKHAHATQVRIYLKANANQVTLSVKDNGRGFSSNQENGATTNGYGLYSIRERARLSGGLVRIDSMAGSGTRIHASWRKDRPNPSHLPHRQTRAS